VEFASYLPLRADNKVILPSPDEADTAVLSRRRQQLDLRFGAHADHHRRHDPVAAGWSAVGLRPRDTGLYCTYLTNGRQRRQRHQEPQVRLGAHRRQHRRALVLQPGACNLSPTTGYPDEVSTSRCRACRPRWRTFNEGQVGRARRARLCDISLEVR